MAAARHRTESSKVSCNDHPRTTMLAFLPTDGVSAVLYGPEWVRAGWQRIVAADRSSIPAVTPDLKQQSPRMNWIDGASYTWLEFPERREYFGVSTWSFVSQLYSSAQLG